MTQYSVPDDLPIFEASDTLGALEDRLADIVNASQIALLRPGAVGSDSERNTSIPAPVAGQRVWRTDKNYEETYFDAVSATVAGWYPSGGVMPGARFSRAASQNVGTAYTAVAFSAVAGEVGWGAIATGNSFTVPVGGRYVLTMKASHSNVSGRRLMALMTGNLGTTLTTSPSFAVTGNTGVLEYTTEVTLVAGTSYAMAVLCDTATTWTNFECRLRYVGATAL